MQRVVPALRVARYADSKPFYVALGFEEEWTHQFEPGLPVFASLQCDGMRLFLTEHRGDCAPGGLVHFYLDDVDAFYRDCLQRGVVIESPPACNIDPDLRDLCLTDPDGNRLMFLTVMD